MRTAASLRRWMLVTLVSVTGGSALAQSTPSDLPPPPPPPPPIEAAPVAAPPLRNNGPRTLEWEPGESVPPGYVPRTQMRTGLVIAGAATFGGVWLLNVLVASVGIDTNQGQAIPLFVPIVGPFIAMGTFRSLQATDVFFLALDGLVQAGGAAMLIAGIAVPKHQLVRDRYASLFMPMPMSFGRGSAGVGFGGTF